MTEQATINPAVFCRDYKSTYDDLDQVIVIDGMSYATDAKIVWRWPTPQEPNSDLRFSPKMVTHEAWSNWPGDKWRPLAELEPDADCTAPCDACGGTGRKHIEKDCLECDGKGEVGFSNDFHSYECTCETCDGDGTIEDYASALVDCKYCRASCVNVVSVGTASLNSQYIRLLAKHMPGTEYHDSGEDWGWVRLRCGEHRGILSKMGVD